MSLIRNVTQTRNTASGIIEKYKQNSTTFTSKMTAKSHSVAKNPYWVEA